MNVKIKTVYGELSFNMTYDNAIALISTAHTYAEAYADSVTVDDTDERYATPVLMDAKAIARAAAPVVEKLANTEKQQNAPPTEKSASKSRLERIFGAKADWKMPASTTTPTEDTESGAEEKPVGYTGFMYIECEECGKVKGFFTKNRLTQYYCACGHATELRDLLLARVRCECNSRLNYHTNIRSNIFTIDCFNCGTPVDMELNAKTKRYETMGLKERRKP